jgi:hypothetical protein
MLKLEWILHVPTLQRWGRWKIVVTRFGAQKILLGLSCNIMLSGSFMHSSESAVSLVASRVRPRVLYSYCTTSCLIRMEHVVLAEKKNLKSCCLSVPLLHCFHLVTDTGWYCCFWDGLAFLSWWCFPYSRFEVDDWFVVSLIHVIKLMTGS